MTRKHLIVIDIRRFGEPYQPLFYTALGGTPGQPPLGTAQMQRRLPLSPQLLRDRPYARTVQPHLQRPLQPARCRLRRPRRLLPDPRRQRRHHRSRHGLRPHTARGPQPGRRSPLSRARKGSHLSRAARGAIKKIVGGSSIFTGHFAISTLFRALKIFPLLECCRAGTIYRLVSPGIGVIGLPELKNPMPVYLP